MHLYQLHFSNLLTHRSHTTIIPYCSSSCTNRQVYCFRLEREFFPLLLLCAYMCGDELKKLVELTQAEFIDFYYDGGNKEADYKAITVNTTVFR